MNDNTVKIYKVEWDYKSNKLVLRETDAEKAPCGNFLVFNRSWGAEYTEEVTRSAIGLSPVEAVIKYLDSQRRAIAEAERQMAEARTLLDPPQVQEADKP